MIVTLLYQDLPDVDGDDDRDDSSCGGGEDDDDNNGVCVCMFFMQENFKGLRFFRTSI